MSEHENTAPQEWEAVLRQQYAKRIRFLADRPIMPSKNDGLGLSVNTLRKLDDQRPKRTECNLPPRLHLSNRTRVYLRNYANVNCLLKLHV